jgi:hypothetical protein
MRQERQASTGTGEELVLAHDIQNEAPAATGAVEIHPEHDTRREMTS